MRILHPLPLTLAACLAMAPAGTAAQEADDPLLGVWVSETRFDDALHGEIVLRREGDGSPRRRTRRSRPPARG